MKTEVGSAGYEKAGEVEDRISKYFRKSFLLISKAVTPLFRSLSVLRSHKTARFIETALCV